MKKQINILAATVISVFGCGSVNAIQFDGFMTAGAAIHDDSENKNIYIGSLGDRGITNDLTFETDTRFGLQISSDVTEDMSVVAQLLGTGVDGNFDASVEWAYIDYKLHDYASIHVGKIKQPVYLVNDYVEVGYAYPWIRPPAEIYYQNNPLNTVNGIELLLQFPAGPGTFSLQPYIGSNRDDIPNAGGAYFEAENIYGIDVKYSGRGYSAHASYFDCDVKTFGGFDIPDSAFGPLSVNLNGEGRCEVQAVGMNLDMANFVVYAEWTDRTTTNELSRPFGDQNGWYTTLGYRMGRWLPHITYAMLDGEASTYGLPDDGAIQGTGFSLNFPVAIQTSITAGLRYELNDSAALKVEYQIVSVEDDNQKLADANLPYDPVSGKYMNYGLFNDDVVGFPGTLPTDDVGIFSVALDVIF